MAANPNLTNIPVESAVQITNAMGTTAQTVYTGPAVGSTQGSGAALVTFAGGAKITRLTTITNDTSTANVYVQISKVLGGVSIPIGDPILIPVATAKGALNSNMVDLLTAIYGAGAAMNLGPGVALQAALSVAVASGKTITILAEGAAF
jgi:hypothetical protein